jgi:poly-gamma-glutamate synthase PgsB/CapB
MLFIVGADREPSLHVSDELPKHIGYHAIILILKYIPAMYFLIISLIFAGYLIAEKAIYTRRLRRIRIRIHINGTRGKSSVTRLVAAALRRSGVRTLAKITGTIPLIILPDGTEEIIRRRSPARILEQMSIVRRAAKLNVEAVVIECMAVDPVLQYYSEIEMLRSTLGIITNVRPDHLEVMGENLEDIAEALSQTIPKDGVLITGDSRYFPFFESRAFRQGTKAFLAEASLSDFPSLAEGLTYFPENAAIAQKVCTTLGLDPSLVLECMKNDSLQQGRSECQLSFQGSRIHFIDAFSANDVESTKIILRRLEADVCCPRPRIALFNNRADRPLRLRSFAEYLAEGDLFDFIAVIGENRPLACRYIRQRVGKARILGLQGKAPERLLEEIGQRLHSPELTVVGLGNEKGPGRQLSLFIRRTASR